MLSTVPYMGISIARRNADLIDEKSVLSVADDMITTGLLSVGYSILMIGDAWIADKRKNGTLCCDTEKFPGGLSSLSKKLKERGITLGVLIGAGFKTENGRPGSFEHEYEDAQFLANEGVGYVACDFSFLPERIDRLTLIRRMGMALRAADVNMIYSVFSQEECFFNHIRSTAACAYRNTSFAKSAAVAFPPDEMAGYSASGCFFNCGEPVFDKSSAIAEVRTSIVTASLMSSPFIVECTPSELSEDALSILKNSSVLNILLDPEARPARRMNKSDSRVYTKFLDGNRYAAAFINLEETDRDIFLSSYDFGLNRDASLTVVAESVFDDESIRFDDYVTVNVKAGDARLYILTLEEADV